MKTDEQREEALKCIRSLCDLEWMGSITIKTFRDRVQDIIAKLEKQEVIK